MPGASVKRWAKPKSIMLNPVAAMVIQTRVRHWRLAAKSQVTHNAPISPVMSRMEGRVSPASQNPGQPDNRWAASTKS